jgi:hypothetical protein
MNGADSDHDPQSSPARATASLRNTTYRLVMVSVRGHKYLLGNTTVHPVDEIPPGIGTRFSNTSAVQDHVRRELAGLSCYHAVEIVADDGHALRRGERSGINSTGNTWVWRDIRPGDAPAPG